MKVLFSNPPWWVQSQQHTMADGQTHTLWVAGVRAGSRWPFTLLTHAEPDQFRFGSYLPYPFFLGYATTYAARALPGAKVHFRDSIALRESYQSYYHFLRQEQFDYIVIESATPSWEHDTRLIQEIQRVLPQVRIVIAGPIAVKGTSLMEQCAIHAVVRGEYEKGCVKVFEGATGVIDFDLLSRDEMNQAPFPYFDQTIAHRYWDPNPRGQKTPHAQVWSSRGCPFKCIFCVWPSTMTGNDPDGSGRRMVRHYSPEYMEAFLRELIDRYHYQSIYFDDDTFNLGDSHVVKMCAVMKKLGIPWSAMCRADTNKFETWGLMRESGCFGVKLGFESGNQFVVDQIVNKHLDLEYARSVVLELKRLGMSVHGTFTYGLPGESQAQMQDTRQYIQSLPFDSIQESGCAEIEGTPLNTLSQTGSLKHYAGAHINEEYVREADGNKKLQQLAEQLRFS